MNDPTEDREWQILFRAIFGRHRTTDESEFTYQVMERVRGLQLDLQVQTWHRFLRWAIPLLGASAACLILATQVPKASRVESLDTALMLDAVVNADPLAQILEESR